MFAGTEDPLVVDGHHRRNGGRRGEHAGRELASNVVVMDQVRCEATGPVGHQPPGERVPRIQQLGQSAVQPLPRNGLDLVAGCTQAADQPPDVGLRAVPAIERFVVHDQDPHGGDNGVKVSCGVGLLVGVRDGAELGWLDALWVGCGLGELDALWAGVEV